MNSKRIFIIATIMLGATVAGCSDELDSFESKKPVATKSGEPESELVWDYPVISGSSSKTTEERFKAYNIPDATLNSISTEELVNICMAYPQWGLMHAYNDRLTGMTVLIKLFNGFQELFKRDDAAMELLKAYDKLDPLAVDPNWTPLQQGMYSAKFEKMEILLCAKPIIDNLDKAGIQYLKEVTVSKYQKKKELPQIYSLWDLSTTVAVCINILEKENPNGLIENRSEINCFMLSLMSEDIQFLDANVELLNTSAL